MIDVSINLTVHPLSIILTFKGLTTDIIKEIFKNTEIRLNMTLMRLEKFYTNIKGNYIMESSLSLKNELRKNGEQRIVY